MTCGHKCDYKKQIREELLDDAVAGKEIVMGKHSSLEPIDPQFNGAPAYNIRLEFEQAKEDLKNNPENYKA